MRQQYSSVRKSSISWRERPHWPAARSPQGTCFVHWQLAHSRSSTSCQWLAIMLVYIVSGCRIVAAADGTWRGCRSVKVLAASTWKAGFGAQRGWYTRVVVTAYHTTADYGVSSMEALCGKGRKRYLAWVLVIPVPDYSRPELRLACKHLSVFNTGAPVQHVRMAVSVQASGRHHWTHNPSQQQAPTRRVCSPRLTA